MQDLKISIIQSDLVWEDVDKNLENFDIKLSKIDDSDLIVLPEMFSTAFSMNPIKFAAFSKKVINWMKEKAKCKNSVICGSLIVEEAGNYFNRLIWMHSDGNYEYYDKRHLFRMGNEHLHFSGGNKRKIINLNGWKVLPLICYDLRFPVWSKNNFVNGEYDFDCIIYLANWPDARSTIWSSLLIARALENQVYVAGVNRIGKDGNGIAHSGKSVIIDPRGNILADARNNTEAIAEAKISLNELNNFREKFTVGLDWDDFCIN